VAAVCRALARLGLRRKKTLYAAEQTDADVTAARVAWRAEEEVIADLAAEAAPSGASQAHAKAAAPQS